MRRSLVNAAIMLLFVQIGQATADPLLDPVTFQKDLSNRAKAAADTIFGAADFKGAHNGGSNGPCHDPVKVMGGGDYYCVKVTIRQNPFLVSGEIYNGLQGAPSFNAMTNDLKRAPGEFARLQSVVTDSWTIPVFAAWSDNRAAVNAVNVRINDLEENSQELRQTIQRTCFLEFKHLKKRSVAWRVDCMISSRSDWNNGRLVSEPRDAKTAIH
jgi:hypothetical protein